MKLTNIVLMISVESKSGIPVKSITDVLEHTGNTVARFHRDLMKRKAISKCITTVIEK